jgi:hypothetical protein
MTRWLEGRAIPVVGGNLGADRTLARKLLTADCFLPAETAYANTACSTADDARLNMPAT